VYKCETACVLHIMLSQYSGWYTLIVYNPNLWLANCTTNKINKHFFQNRTRYRNTPRGHQN